MISDIKYITIMPINVIINGVVAGVCMENIVIGIVSADRDYCKALGLSLMSVCDDFIIRYYETGRFVSEWGSYNGEGEYCDSFDLILWDGREIEDTFGGKMIYLAEKASQVRQDHREKKFSLYKYCGATAMTSAIFEIYTSLTGRGTAFIKKDAVDLIAVGSWEGGAGCTTVTLAVAQELRRFHGSRILIISLETIESTSKYFDYVPEVKSIGEYLYRVLPERILSPDRPSPFLESYVVRDLYGIEAFAPSRGINPVSGLCEGDVQKLLATIIDSGRYDAVLIDMGTCLTKAAVAVMEMADKICFVCRDTKVSHREEVYFGHIIFCSGEATLAKAIRLTNGYRGPGSAAAGDGKGENGFVSERASARAFDTSVSGNEPEQLMLEGAFGEDIRKLALHLLKR